MEVIHAHPSAGASPLPRRPPARPDALLADLTSEQARAVRHGTGPLLLIAGPGAGKTKTITHRIAHLLAGHAQPSQILTVTFSVRATGELRLRLGDLLGQERATGVSTATYHAVCARILREHPPAIGRRENWTVYDQTDLRHAIE